MKKIFSILTVVATLFAISCSSEYDDTAVWNELGKHDERISKLETLCGQMNTNISSLQAIVTALQSNDYVTGVAPITQNGVEVGYTITFSKSGSITIYHGKDGKDGADGKDGVDGTNGADGKDGLTPVIGVKQDTDGVYYWTLDGQWLLDSEGYKVRASPIDGVDGEDGKDGTSGSDGAAGKDGITPQLKIEDGYWYVSYNNGESWEQLGKATGEDGQDGENGANGADGAAGKDGDSFFQSVTQDENSVTFTLADGTVITLPKGTTLSIEFDSDDLVVMSPSSTREIGYTVTSATESVTVETTSSADIKAKVVANGLTGKIVVTTGETIDEYSKVVVLVSNGDKVIMRSITFEQAGLKVEDNATKLVNAEGGEVVLEFLTNTECEVVIPEEAQSWISVVPATRALEKRSITLKLEANEGNARSAEVQVKSADGKLSITYIIEQNEPKPANNEIWYTSSNKVKNIINIFGESYTEANIISHTYNYTTGKGVIIFDIPIVIIGDRAFESKNILSLVLPNSITTIEDNAFRYSNVHDGITIPDSVTSIGDSAFWGSYISKINLGKGVKTIGEYAFAYCRNLYTLNIPDSVEDIGDWLLYESYVYHIYLGSGLKSLGYGWSSYGHLEGIHIKDLSSFFKISTDSMSCIRVYLGEEMIEDLIIPEDITDLRRSHFSGWNTLKSITISHHVNTIEDSLLSNCKNLTTINGKYASTDNRCLVFDGILNSFAQAGLTEYTVPDGVASIGSSAFYNCDGLTSVTIPDSVTSIGNAAFRGCNSLTSVYCKPTTPPTLKNLTFEDNHYSRKIYVPIGCAETYKSASGWKDYASRIEEYNF